MHEGGWTIEGDPRRQLTFVRPNGDRLETPHMFLGSADPVEVEGRAAADGRCGWLGDQMDVEYTIDVVTDTTIVNRPRAPQGARVRTPAA